MNATNKTCSRHDIDKWSNQSLLEIGSCDHSGIKMICCAVITLIINWCDAYTCT